MSEPSPARHQTPHDEFEVTAVVPAYERPEMTVQAIRSALAQTHAGVRVFVGDDSRTDHVCRAVHELADPRVSYHRNLQPLGAQANWVDLVRRADTPFVASLNNDDVWEPKFVERCLPALLADDECGISFCDAWYIDDEGRRLQAESDHWSQQSHRATLPTGPVPPDAATMLRLIAVWNAPQPAYAAVMRRAAVASIDFPADVDPCHDLWCTYELWRGGWRFHYVGERLTNYRVHPGNLTNEGFAKAEDFIFAEIAAENGGNPALPEVLDRWGAIRFSRATRALRLGQPYSASRAEFRGASPLLHGWRRPLAWSGARSSAVCAGLARLRAARSRGAS